MRVDQINNKSSTNGNEKLETVKDRSYSMQSGVEAVVLDATHYRNLGAFINHSATPNAQAECIFDKGAEQAVIIATVRVISSSSLFDSDHTQTNTHSLYPSVLMTILTLSLYTLC
jgi:SET domain-containing protein